MNSREELLRKYNAVRLESLKMCAPLMPEDFQVQTMEEVSPPKWNLGHTSWFFARFLLRPRGLSLPIDDRYAYYLNSYYHKAGQMGGRGRRGLVTRPAVDDIMDYRTTVDRRMERLIRTADEKEGASLDFLVTVGINHEQQHQELFRTEIKHIYHQNPPGLRPAYKAPPGNGSAPAVENPPPGKPRFAGFMPGLYEVGNVEGGWCWDNELRVHDVYLNGFALMERLVTNAEYMEFMEDGGYGNVLFWLSDGWYEKERQGWEAPLYWEKVDGVWRIFTLTGMRDVGPSEPVSHVSFYEADAFARWKAQADPDFRGARLPTEFEWEHAARESDVFALKGNFVEDGLLHPAPSPCCNRVPLQQMMGDLWEWTGSHYGPYPGFKEFPDDLSEYNGKFMNNQRVLRGGSCATPREHMRISYRNFWHPAARFQFTGIRLAKDMGSKAA